jgi:GTPase SAR1 family protein
MGKKCLVITGPSTVGKSTVVKSVLVHLPDIHVIPLSTSRLRRKDDDSMYIRNFSDSSFSKQDFFVRNGQYGLIERDIQIFEKSSSSYGVCILGAKEIEEIKKTRFEIKVVLLRFHDSLAEEIELVRKRIPNFFPAEEAKERIQNNEKLLMQYFYNPEFLKNCVQKIHLFREGVDVITRSIVSFIG